MNFDVICHYIEFFNMSVCGTDYLRGVVYKRISYVLVCCVYSYQYFSFLYN